jgi:hypothetical protein
MDANNPKERGLPPASTRAGAKDADLQPPTAKQLVDITAQSSKMPRGSAILCECDTELPLEPDPPHNRGLTVLDSGLTHWITGWKRIVKDREVIELRFSPGRPR